MSTIETKSRKNTHQLEIRDIMVANITQLDNNENMPIWIQHFHDIVRHE
jgi:hypothetical protein